MSAKKGRLFLGALSATRSSPASISSAIIEGDPYSGTKLQRTSVEIRLILVEALAI